LNNSNSDWAYLEKFQLENEVLKKQFDESRIVFIGDSIIAGWNERPMFIENSHFINRGVNGQTTDQVLHRFPYDVIALRPKYVVILVGTNDVAENNGAISLEEIQTNFQSMLAIAEKNELKVILCSILPASEYYWNKRISQPNDKIKILNQFLSSLANSSNIFFLDFYAELVENNAINKKYSSDGVHPNSEGYKLITETLKKILNF
jgi:alpha-L-fucosidase